MRWFLVSLAIAGCASAGKGNSVIGGVDDAGVDADFPEPDASPFDAPPHQITLSQTVSAVITRENTYFCVEDDTSWTRENIYYRVFTPSDFNITTTLHVSEVSFGIEAALAGGSATEQPAQLKIGTYGVAPTGTTLDLAEIRPIASVDIAIPDGEGTWMAVPITGDIPPTTNLIVELAVPDGLDAGNEFVIGSNAQGERRPGYTRAPSCKVFVPTTMHSIAEKEGRREADILLTVTGTI